MKKQRTMYGIAAMLCIILLVAMRSTVSWRPRKIAFVGAQRSDDIRAPRSRVAAGGRVLLVETGNGARENLLAWDTSSWKLKRELPLLIPVPGLAPVRREIISYDVSPDGRESVTIKSIGPHKWGLPSMSLGEISSLGGSPTHPLAQAQVRESDFIGGNARSAFTRFSSDGRQIGVATSQGVLFWDGKSGALIRRVAPPSIPYTSKSTLSPDFKTVIQSSAGQMNLWDVRGKPRKIAAHIIGGSPCFSPNSERFIYLAPKGSMLICADASTGRSLWTAPWNRRTHNMIWSRDGGTVFALDENRISAFEAQGGAQLGSVSVVNVVQILPSPVSNEVWCLDSKAQLWSQRVY